MSERLTVPMVRDNGNLREQHGTKLLIEQLQVSRKFSQNMARSFLAFFLVVQTTNEVNYAAQRFSRSVIGSNNIDSCNRT